jgi:hypothetical protein
VAFHCDSIDVASAFVVVIVANLDFVDIDLGMQNLM